MSTLTETPLKELFARHAALSQGVRSPFGDTIPRSLFGELVTVALDDRAPTTSLRLSP